MTVSTTDIPVLHYADVVHLTVSRVSHLPGVCKSLKYYQGEQARYTMKPFKGSSNKLGPLGVCGPSLGVARSTVHTS